ncbi:MAG: hypothetical protein K2I14_04380 [Eubacterium sp.]|nr:hypothetical protein [Eubacterium sp.]
MSKKKKIYTVATAHLDTIWSWDFEKTVSTYIYNTLVDNFKMFKKYPTYKFNFEGSYRYELMEEYYPELFEKVKEYVKEGRWNVCGSAFENGDTNIPSPEALFRNILFGNSYFDKTFGKRSVDIYLPDCFGFGWALPSIEHHANLKGFTTQKLTWGSAYGTPFDIGKWYGVDGNYVYACVNPHDYYYTFTKLRDWDFVLDKFKKNEEYDLDWTYMFHGIGDRGGAPKEKSISFVEEETKKNDSDDIEVYVAEADEIYHDIDNKLTQEQRDKLPVWKTELVMQNHGVGGYTSRAVGKRWNRRCEELADIAERNSVVASYLGAYDYNSKVINRSWKRFIAHQFHDDMPGTSVQRAYRRSWNDYAMSANQFKGELEASTAAVSTLMKTDFCTGTPIVVSNPIEADITSAVKIRLNRNNKFYARVFDDKGKEVKSQVNSIKDGVMEIVFIASVKSLGFRVYDVRPSDEPCKVKSEISIHDNTAENQKYIVRLNKQGNIESIIDKTLDDKELLKEPVVLGLYNYTGSKDWPAWEMNYEEANKNADRIPNLVSISIEENGPARVAFSVVQEDQKRSVFTNIIALSDGGECVEVYSEIEWQSLCTLAKNKFAFNCSNEKATFDLGLGAIERENMSEKLFEVPAQKWADLTDESGSFGVSVISECKYGWDKFDNHSLRLTVLHTPLKNYRIDSMQSMLDIGLNRYSFAIFSHSGKVGKATQLEARKFVQPMIAVLAEKHSGKLGSDYSFGKISADNVIIRALKKAEDSDEIIIRLNEGANENAENVLIELGNGIDSAKEMFASEEFKCDAVVENGKLVTSFKPYEIKTFAVTLKESDVKGKKAKSAPANVKFDKNIITHQRNEKSDFEYNIPREITPESVSVNGIDFAISKTSANAFVLNGQKIELSENTDKLCLLCASLNDDKFVTFDVDGKKVSKKVFNMFEAFAAWDLVDLGDTAYVKDGKLGFEATHCHVNGNDAIAKGMYFYIVEMDVKGKKCVTLPFENDVVVISATEYFGNDAKLITPVFDEVDEKRKQTFKMTAAEKVRYQKYKCVWNLNDRDNFITHRNKGRN